LEGRVEKRPVLKGILVILFAGAVTWLYLWHAAADGRPDYARSHLAIERADGTVFPFRIEIAKTPQEQQYGLMFVKKLAPDQGMIFPYVPPQTVAFWMKNTLIPLDMLFVGPDHKIARIVENAKPQDLTPIPSLQPVEAVIEIKGGQSRTDGIAVGDQVHY